MRPQFTKCLYKKGKYIVRINFQLFNLVLPSSFTSHDQHGMVLSVI